MGIMVGDVVIVVGGKAEASPKAKQQQVSNKEKD
jgi:hypothetical protein